jgi:hypothetical protein
VVDPPGEVYVLGNHARLETGLIRQKVQQRQPVEKKAEEFELVMVEMRAAECELPISKQKPEPEPEELQLVQK